MGIFITAIFLVLFFLFYRHTKAMFKTTGALVAVVGLGILGFVLWDEYTAQERAMQSAQQRAHDRELSLEQERQREQAEAEQEQERLKRQSAAAEAAVLQAAAYEAGKTLPITGFSRRR